jgi:hypothetical protein
MNLGCGEKPDGARVVSAQNKGSNGSLRCSLACTLPQVLRQTSWLLQGRVLGASSFAA